MFYVYAYLDPRKKGKFEYNGIKFEYQPFYIGKGIGKRCIRAIEPNRLKKEKKSIKRNYIIKLIKLGLKPIIIKLFENLTESEAFEKEIQLIESIGRINLKTGPLTNMTEGGDGISGNVISEETRKKISEAHKGKKLTEEHKRLLSIKNKQALAAKGGKFTREHIEKLKIANSRPRGQMSIQSRLSKCNKYLIISPDGIEYKIKGLKDFCKEHTLNLSQMRRVSKGVLETYKGWKCITLTNKYKRHYQLKEK